MKDMKLKLIMALALIMTGVMGATVADAALATYSDSVTGSSPPSYAKYTADTLSLNQFNPALGTLMKVTLTLDNDFIGAAGAENTNTQNTKTFAYSLTAMTLDIRYAGDPAKLLNNVTPSYSRTSVTLGLYDGNTNYGGTSGVTYVIDPALYAPASLMYTLAADLNRYKGIGTINFDIWTGAPFSLTGNAAAKMSYANFLTHATVVYEYTPVPIPPAAWFLGSGILGLVAIRRRFKK